MTADRLGGRAGRQGRAERAIATAYQRLGRRYLGARVALSVAGCVGAVCVALGLAARYTAVSRAEAVRLFVLAVAATLLTVGLAAARSRPDARPLLGWIDGARAEADAAAARRAAPGPPPRFTGAGEAPP